MKPSVHHITKPGRSSLPRSSPPRNQAPAGQLSPVKKPGLSRQLSYNTFSRTMQPTRSLTIIERPVKSITLYEVPPPRSEPATITIRYRSCEHTLRPRPETFSELIDRLRNVVLFGGEPVMTYHDPTGKLKYVADYHEMVRAYREFPDQITVDLRFD